MKRIRKAVLPVAGLGTRFLPATKAVPKEMLTVVDVRWCSTSSTRRRKPASSTSSSSPAAQGGDRGSFRHRVRARPHAAGARQAGDVRGAEEGPAGRRPDQLHPPAGADLASATRCGAPREIVGDEPFAVLLPDMLSRGCMPDARRLRPARRQRHRGRGGRARPDPPVRHRRRRSRISATLSRSTEWSRSRRRAPPRRTSSSRAATSSTGDLRDPGERRKGRRGEIQLTDAMIKLAQTQDFFGLRYTAARPTHRLEARLPHREPRLRPAARRAARGPQARDRGADARRVGPSRPRTDFAQER